MTEDKYQEQCSAVVRLVQSSQYKYRAEQCVCECVGYAVQYAIAIILEIYLYQTRKKNTNQNKQQHQRTSSSRVTSYRIYNTVKRRDKKYIQQQQQRASHIRIKQYTYTAAGQDSIRVFAQL